MPRDPRFTEGDVPGNGQSICTSKTTIARARHYASAEAEEAMMVLETKMTKSCMNENVAQQADACITMPLGKTQYSGSGYSSLPVFHPFNGFIIFINALAVHLDSR